jgi:hypothetical protein
MNCLVVRRVLPGRRSTKRLELDALVTLFPFINDLEGQSLVQLDAGVGDNDDTTLLTL